MKQIRIVIPTGRLAQNSVDLLEKTGLKWVEFGDSRQLSFYDEANDAWLFLAKPADVATYVEHGVADIGVVGKDLLLEESRNVLELLDLKFGECRIVLAKPESCSKEITTGLRIATKYPNITDEYLKQKGVHAHIIPVNGSVELAPQAGLADMVVDLVSTGRTLAENHLVVVEDLVTISARLIANQSSYHVKFKTIQEMITQIEEAIRTKEGGRCE